MPADRKLYALRDATATVESLPLIAASVMSKKLACGAPAIVLDVKVGGGAFMKTLDDARALAELMIKIGRAHGRHVAAVLSDMNAPLGRAVGNLLEVVEVACLLRHPAGADPRLLTLVRHLSARRLSSAARRRTLEEGLALADRQLQSGAARAKWIEIITAQGGDANAPLRPAPVQHEVRADKGGFLAGIAADAIGLAAMRLGAGRAAKDDQIDPAAGIILAKAPGDAVAIGDTLATLYTRTEAQAFSVAASVQSAFQITDQPNDLSPLIYDTLGLPSRHVPTA